MTEYLTISLSYTWYTLLNPLKKFDYNSVF